MPLLSAMRDGWGYSDGVAETYLDLLSMDMTRLLFSTFSDSVLTNAKCTMFSSMKEPDTTYSNSLSGTDYFFPTRKYFKLLTSDSNFII